MPDPIRHHTCSPQKPLLGLLVQTGPKILDMIFKRGRQALLNRGEVLIATSLAGNLLDGHAAEVASFYVLTPAADLGSLLARRCGAL